MDSKQPIPTSAYDDADPAPPSYSESISSSTYYSTQIRSQLNTLSTTITAIESQKSVLNSAREEKILSLLTTQIQIFLSDFANSGRKRGTLILVPAAGLTDDNAIPTDYDFKDRDEYDRVVRVRSKGESSYNESSSEEQETWYWENEDMALRLASSLNPSSKAELPPRSVRLSHEPPAEGSSSRSFWGRKKGVAKPPLITPSSSEPIPTYEKSQGQEDNVKMLVKAEEVVFRTENDFGIFGTERGWGIVLKLRVDMSGDRR